uniref:Sema domain-containing protein n=1 Tax=Sinocyclocheilus rhinocerous TaxID=307959 RepID=A0A673J331_9TELE
AKAFLEPRNILSSRFARASPRSLRLLAAALAVFLTALQARTAGALQIQQAFASPSRTNNFLVDAVSRRVYLAAVNSLYQLNATLAREVETRTGPVLDNPLCHAPQLPQATCEHQKTLTDNHNKLLTLDRAQGVLLACGSVFQGFCELRAMDDASRLAVRFPQDGATVFPSMLNIAANHENASTVGLVFRSHGGAARLLVAATYTGMGSEYFPKNHSKEDLRFENTPEIAIRSLDIADIGRLFTYDINPSEDNVFKIKQEVKQKNKLSFVRAFVHKSYSYIAINNDANAGVKESQPNSILARICLDTDAPRRSAESRKLTESYIQMGLQCGSSGNIYSRLLSIYPADISSGGAAGAEPHLFGVFAQAGGRAAVCAFRVLEVEERLQPHDILFISLQEEQLNCGAAHLQHPLALRRPLRARPIYEAPGLSSIAVDNVHNRTVMFLGTSRGRLRKLSLLANLSMANQWSLKLASNEPVHHIMTFDPSDHNYLYLMTTHHVTVQVSACGQYSSCSECVSAGDAHCGWCTLERRCSVQKNCSSGTLGRSWISTGDGVQQCPSMTITPSEISRSDVGILINGSVPDLQGLQVECDYGVGITTNATVHLDYSTTQIQTCPLLPLHMYPTIPFGTDHVTVPMAIRVNGVSVVSGNFTIYECERTGQIHFKTACTSCLSTAWHCYWDPRLNLCVSSKESTPHTVSQACSVLILTQILSHTQTVPQACSVLMRSCARVAACVSPVHPQMALPDPDWVKAVLQTSGRASKDRCVMCVCVCVCVCAVEVYSCSAGDSDCSQCWGRQTQGHMCVWCDNSCQQRDQCHAITTRCPDLSSSKVEPLSGPLTGGTLLTVQGRNLGHSATQLNVSIGHVPCSVLPQYYTVSVRLVCETGASWEQTSDHVTVRVAGNAVGVSKDIFSFVVRARLLEFTPQQGPLAGGTRLTIHGQFLDAGSTVNVKINRTQNCTIFMLSSDVIECVMPPAEAAAAENVSVCVVYDDRPCLSASPSFTFTYEKNPTISHIRPNKSFLRSKCWCVCVIFQSVRSFIQMSFPQICSCVSSTLIVCQSPATNQSQQATAHFYLNEVLYRGEDASPSGRGPDEDEEPHADAFHFDYVEDPQFYTANKEKLIKHHPGEPLILIINKGPSELDLTLQEYSVTIGSDLCDITFHNEQLFHCTINRSLSASTGELPVTVRVGHFQKVIAMVQMGGGSELAIIVSIVVCCVLLLLCTVALVVYCTKSRRAERDWQKTLLQMEEMESQIRDEIRKGFAELQTDMTDLTKELSRTQGIPFLEYKQFVTRTFFPKMCSDYERRLVQPMYENDPLGPRALSETHPLLQDWQSSNSVRPNLEEGITLFSTLLNNKHFLVTFVHALEQQKDFAVRDRCNLASLLTIALHGKLEYYTSIMKELLVDLIDASASKNPKLMLRRTESVVEKMLTNWMSICMYSYLKETVGEPFFLLLCAIKQQINKGSIDAITGKARYTLNEEWLLRENIEAKPQNINVSFQGFGMDSVSVRVMNTDTICQVKDKILEAFYKNLPFSQWPREEDVDLEWFPEGRSSRILQDLDNTSVMEDGRKKLNTVFHYQIPDGASLAMSMKDKRENTLGRVKDLDTEKYVHLVLPHDELTESRKSHRHSHRKKVLPEIYLTRLLSTKGTLQKFLDDLFQAILSIPPEKPPLAIKYFFDFLEEQADKRGITDPDTLHIWKTNSLPLRFWVNILKNPQFVFDIDKTDHMDACLSVIAQAFIDACSLSDLQLGKDSPTNKLLYAKEIPEYKKRVQCYYKQIQEMAPLSEQEMNAHLAEESRRYRNEFNTNLAVMEVYKYAKRYRNQVVSALDSSPTARRTQLQHKFEQVIALVEDNIYECSSEA